MELQLEGKVAIVTGGAKGIGAAIATMFAQNGARVIVGDIDEEAGHAVAEAHDTCSFRHLDVTSEESVAAAVDVAMARFGRLDIMVNNAGLIGVTGRIATIPAEGWRATLAVLLDSVFYGIKHAARVMVPQGSGRILTTTSTASLASGLGAHVYTTAKHGVLGLIQSTAVELAPHGICVNGVAPGSTVTPLAIAFYNDAATAHAACAAETPLGDAIMPEDIARGFLFLAGAGGRLVTGQSLVIDGGVLAVGNGSGRVFYGG